MRVIAGSARGRKLKSPPDDSTRPITDRAKESIFNMLQSFGGLVDMTVMDLYAGCGSFGIESLSRGAESVQFVERSSACLSVLKENVTTIGFEDRATFHGQSVARFLQSQRRCDIAFCDPPYADDPWGFLLGEIEAQILVAHTSVPLELTDRWVERKRRTYGRSHIVIAEQKS